MCSTVTRDAEPSSHGAEVESASREQAEGQPSEAPAGEAVPATHSRDSPQPAAPQESASHEQAVGQPSETPKSLKFGRTIFLNRLVTYLPLLVVSK